LLGPVAKGVELGGTASHLDDELDGGQQVLKGDDVLVEWSVNLEAIEQNLEVSQYRLDVSGGSVGIAVPLDAAGRLDHRSSDEGVTLAQQPGDDASYQSEAAFLEHRVGLGSELRGDLTGSRGERDTVDPLLGTRRGTRPVPQPEDARFGCDR
jgi:hypothetical protein